MKSNKLTLSAIALTLGLLNPLNANAEHLIKKLMPYQSNGRINSKHFVDSSHLPVNGQIVKMNRYKIDGMKIGTFYFPFPAGAVEGGIMLVYPEYPQGYLIEGNGAKEYYVDEKMDGLNGNESMRKIEDKKKESKPLNTI